MELTIEAALQKGVEAHKAGKVQEADQYYTAVLNSQPNHPDANHNMGVLAVGVGQVDKSLPFFKKALEVNSTITQFWISYIDALMKLEQFEDAKAVLTQAKENGLNDDRFDIFKASLKSQTIAYSDVSQEEQRALVDLYNQGKTQITLTKATKLLMKYPRSIFLLNIVGSINRKMGNLDQAIEFFQKVITLKPDFTEGFYNLGNAFKEKGKLKDAIEAYKRSIVLRPNYAEAFYNLGIALKDKGDLEDAIAAYNKAISIKSDYAEAYNNMGFVLREQGKLENAINAFNKAIEINPDFSEAHNNLGTCLFETNHVGLAIDSYRQALELKPDYLLALSNLANAVKGVLFTNPNKKLMPILERLFGPEFSGETKGPCAGNN